MNRNMGKQTSFAVCVGFKINKKFTKIHTKICFDKKKDIQAFVVAISSPLRKKILSRYIIVVVCRHFVNNDGMF